MCIEVQIAVGCDSVPEAGDLRRWAKRALQGEAGGLCVRIVGVREGRSLNGKYRGIERATNVLSFATGGIIPGVLPTKTAGAEAGVYPPSHQSFPRRDSVAEFAAEAEVSPDRSAAERFATDTVGLCLDSAAPLSKHWGDVVICAPVVEAEARQQNKAIAHHYAHMVIHGVLHLRGFDHETESQAREMERLETRILGEIGISDPYAA